MFEKLGFYKTSLQDRVPNSNAGITIAFSEQERFGEMDRNNSLLCRVPSEIW